jgi:hypothetical protein
VISIPKCHGKSLTELLGAAADPEQALAVFGEKTPGLMGRRKVIGTASRSGEDHDVIAGAAPSKCALHHRCGIYCARR